MKLKRLAALALTGVITLTTLFGCGANANKTIATLGNEKVTFGVANFIVKYQKSSVDDMYAMYAGLYGVDSLWTTDTSGSGSTTEVEFKQSAMDMIHEMYTLKAHLADYGVELTAEDEAAIKEAATAFLAANTKEAIKEFGATEEIVVEALKLYTIQAKMYNKIIEGTDRNVSDEEANMRGYSMMQIDLTGYYDDDSNWIEYTEEEVAEIKTKAQGMQLDLKTKKLEEVAENYGYEVSSEAYAKNDDALAEEVLAALDALAEGEVSNMVETEDSIYFLRIDADTDEEATEENRQSIITEREYAYYEEVVKKWQENDGWKYEESMLDDIDFRNSFTIYADEEGTEASDATETVDGTEE